MCSTNTTPKTNKFHGYTSIIFFLAAIATGIYATAGFSTAGAILNIVFLILMILSVSYYYCAKCPVREKCNHWLFGKVSICVSEFKNEKYNAFDLVFGTLIPIAIVIVIPQYWLIKMPVLLLIYWGFMVIAGLQVTFFVCTTCENDKCTMCKNKVKNIHEKTH